ncbi:hypothetical protein HHL11_07075 [Ramlibacter sp. G-1-2-2]|uniref:Uncharacterized protein n=1 Tax=Ramlibacter agri TaxID=2728837 RepID=A0A848GYV6_9BURK|nr:hypothetical protein [Ramlibacter agri]NML43504.1 hypothetical protein [Ramlibacter agri]
MTVAIEQQRGAVGKAELAEALGWTRPRLDRRLQQDAQFPVQQRGSRAGGWEFNLAAVLAYLGETQDGARAEPSGRPQLAGRATAPTEGRRVAAPGVQHHGELTASQRHKLAQARLLEDKLEQSRRALIDAEEMRLVVGTMLAHLGKGLDGLPDAALRRLELPEEARPVLQALVDDLRRNVVADLKGLLQ